MQESFIYIIYSILVLILTFLPGYCIVNKFKNINSMQKFILVPCFSICIFVLLAFVTAVNSLFSLIILTLLSLYSIYLLKKVKVNKEYLFVIFSLLLLVSVGLLLSILIKFPAGGMDWAGHTLIVPEKFVDNDWRPDTTRTPIYNLIIYNYHKLFSIGLNEYWLSQIISIILSSLFIIPSFFISKELFGIKTAKLTVLFFCVTPFLLYNIFYTWPKMLAVFFILSFAYLLLIKRDKNFTEYTIAGFLAALSYMVHSYSAFFVLIVFLIAFLNDKNRKLLACFIIFFVLFLIPYYLWIYLSYNSIPSSNFVYYPFAIVEGDVYESPEFIINKFFSLSLIDVIKIRAENFLLTTLPILPEAIKLFSSSEIIKSLPFFFYYNYSIPGGVTFIIYIASLFLLIEAAKRKVNDKFKNILFLVVLSLILASLFVGFRVFGLLNQLLHPIVPMIIILVFGFINEKKLLNKKVIFFIFLIAVLETILLFNSVSELGKHEYNLIEPGIIIHVPEFKISELVSANIYANSIFTVTLIILIMVFISYILYLNKEA